MKIFEREVDAREHASASSTPNNPRRNQPRMPTAATLVTSSSGQNSGSVSCVYCGQGHTSNSCKKVSGVAARKEILLKAGRCYTCLRKHHLSKDCRSNISCKNCRGRHHVSICSRHATQDSNDPPQQTPPSSGSSPQDSNMPRTTNSLYVGTQTPVLLQTAQLQLFNPSSKGPYAVARAIMDGGSQRTYVTCRLRDELSLPTVRTESLMIKTFRNAESHVSKRDVVQLGLSTKDGENLQITALVVPFVCHPLTTQPISHSKECYDHLLGLELADNALLESGYRKNHSRELWTYSNSHQTRMGPLRASRRAGSSHESHSQLHPGPEGRFLPTGTNIG